MKLSMQITGLVRGAIMSTLFLLNITCKTQEARSSLGIPLSRIERCTIYGLAFRGSAYASPKPEA